MTRKRYADTLESIARKGPGVFYTGRMAETTISALRSRNGIMTMQDLQEYSVAIREPVHITYRDYKITAGSAPSGGAVALSALKTVEGYADFELATTANLSTHRLDEAFRFAFGEVSYGYLFLIKGTTEVNPACAARRPVFYSGFEGLRIRHA